MRKVCCLLSRMRLFFLLILSLAFYSIVQENRIVRDVFLRKKKPSSSFHAGVNDDDVALALDEADRERPEIVWLASYPNSGTSYTMTLVERASNLSTATNYGAEVTAKGDMSEPVHENHPEGPYWDGLSGHLGFAIRYLPEKYVLTKTHCGGRCLYCGAKDYMVNTEEFLMQCEKTSRLGWKGKRFESAMDRSRVKKLVHLIRHPLHNIVARYHLDRRHLLVKKQMTEEDLPYNATGFNRWCKDFDEGYAVEEALIDATTRELMQSIPCRAEFYKYVQWHERVLEMVPLLGGDDDAPTLTLYYEDYKFQFNETVDRIMSFVEQDVVSKLRPFRDLPTYEDHFTLEQIRAIAAFIEHMASPRLWDMLKRYFQDEFGLISNWAL